MVAPTHAKFRGDSAEDLDMLIAACNAPAGPPSAAGLLTRDLTPFCFDDAPDPKKQQPRRSAPNLRTPPACGASARGHAKAAAAGGIGSPSSPPGSPRSSSSVKAANAAPPPLSCPAFFTSPRPEVLPMPTSLLTRAVSVKA